MNNDDLIMKKSPERIELQFHESGESTLIKNKILKNLRNSAWENAVREEIKQYLNKAGDDVTSKEVFEAVKDMARREIPTNVKKELYDLVLEFVKSTNKE